MEGAKVAQIAQLKATIGAANSKLNELEKRYENRTSQTRRRIRKNRDARVEEDVHSIVKYNAHKEQLNRNANDIYGEHEMESFLKAHRHKIKKLPCAIQLQAWWRMTIRRRKYLNYIRNRTARLQGIFFEWKIARKVRKLSDASMTRRMFIRWGRYTREIVETRMNIKKMVKLQNNPMLSKLFESKLGNQKDKVIPLPGNRVTTPEIRDNLLEEYRMKKLLMSKWRSYMTAAKIRRNEACKRIRMSMRFTKSDDSKGILWESERVHAIFHIWYRWSQHKRAIRKSAPTRVYNEYLEVWDRWMRKFEWAQNRKEVAGVFMRLTILRKTFNGLVSYYEYRKRKQKNAEIAIAKYHKSRLYWTKKKWMEAAKSRGRIFRLLRKIVKLWQAWASKKVKQRAVKSLIYSDHLIEERKRTVRKWADAKKKNHPQEIVNRDYLFCHNSKEYFLVLYSMLMWRNNITKASFLYCWHQWKIFSCRRRAWLNMKYKERHHEALRLQTRAFAVWSGKRSTFEGEEETAPEILDELVHGDDCYAETSWTLSQCELDQLYTWLSDTSRAVSQFTPLHQLCDTGNQAQVETLLSKMHQMPQVEEENQAKTSSLKSLKFKMQSALRINSHESSHFLSKLEKDISTKSQESTTTCDERIVFYCDDDGETALHKAARHYDDSFFPIVVLLLGAGSSVFIRNHAGQRPLDVATNPKVKHLLEAHEQRIESRNFTRAEIMAYRKLRCDGLWSDMSLVGIWHQVVDMVIHNQNHESKPFHVITIPTPVPNPIILERIQRHIAMIRSRRLSTIETRDKSMLKRSEIRRNLGRLASKLPDASHFLNQFVQSSRDMSLIGVEEGTLVWRDGCQVHDGSPDLHENDVWVGQKPMLPCCSCDRNRTQKHCYTCGKSFAAYFKHKFVIADRWESLELLTENTAALYHQQALELCESTWESRDADEEISNLWKMASEIHYQEILAIDGLVSYVETKMTLIEDEIEKLEHSRQETQGELEKCRTAKEFIAKQISAEKKSTSGQTKSVDKKISNIDTQIEEFQRKKLSIDKIMEPLKRQKKTETDQYLKCVRELGELDESMAKLEQQKRNHEKMKMHSNNAFVSLVATRFHNLQVCTDREHELERQIKSFEDVIAVERVPYINFKIVLDKLVDEVLPKLHSIMNDELSRIKNPYNMESCDLQTRPAGRSRGILNEDFDFDLPALSDRPEIEEEELEEAVETPQRLSKSDVRSIQRRTYQREFISEDVQDELLKPVDPNTAEGRAMMERILAQEREYTALGTIHQANKDDPNVMNHYDDEAKKLLFEGRMDALVDDDENKDEESFRVEFYRSKKGDRRPSVVEMPSLGMSAFEFTGELEDVPYGFANFVLDDDLEEDEETGDANTQQPREYFSIMWKLHQPSIAFQDFEQHCVVRENVFTNPFVKLARYNSKRHHAVENLLDGEELTQELDMDDEDEVDEDEDVGPQLANIRVNLA